MPKVEIELADSVFEKVKDQSDKIGVSVEEYIRFVLGERVQLAPSTLMYCPSEMLEPTEGDTASLPEVFSEQFYAGVGKGLQMVEAMRGGLTCERCTQKLGMEDVKNGMCSRCECPLE